VSSLLRKLSGLGSRDRVATLLEEVDPSAAARLRDTTSDAGRYLLGLAAWDDRLRDLLERETDVRAALERSGYWEEYDEWRIGTVSTNRIELEGSSYHVSSECDGTYAARVGSLPVALEATQVLFGLARDLFWEVGWASWERPSTKHGVRKPYLARIAREAAKSARARPNRIDWNGGTGYQVVIERGCISMTCVSPTVERATHFAGIFETVSDDLLRLLGWC
jgi:hypothetical protein